MPKLSRATVLFLCRKDPVLNTLLRWRASSRLVIVAPQPNDRMPSAPPGSGQVPVFQPSNVLLPNGSVGETNNREAD